MTICDFLNAEALSHLYDLNHSVINLYCNVPTLIEDTNSMSTSS